MSLRQVLTGLSSLIADLHHEPLVGPYSVSEFTQRVDSALQARGCLALPRSLVAESDRQGFILRYALKMAEISYRRLQEPAPAPDPDLLARFTAAVGRYPSARVEYCQGAVEPASSLRRALEMDARLQGQGPVLFLGDDDATSVALTMLGDYAVTALDIDTRIIEWLRAAAPGLDLQAIDLRELPESFHGRYAAVATDPVADFEVARQFLKAAVDCLQPRGWLFWADHPDWNLGYQGLLDAASELGLDVVAVHPNWHSYRAVVYDDSTAEWFKIPPEWFRRLSRLIRIWSNLVVLRMR